MIDRTEALRIAHQAIAELVGPDIEFEINEPAMQEHPFGWVVFYQSPRFLETRDPQHALAGNAPLIVDRQDGSTHPIATGRAVAEAVAEYMRSWKGPGTPA